ncbi:MAG TPA: quinone-dependent dihydroorotate dehydrogenase [Steroidobacteraceae bacterium]|jgi:dihydroorotate dehydrogenase|nr:quinone-dependent dihydroorotate dehydrogenase [Steroidobacteraceae bacterium]
MRHSPASVIARASLPILTRLDPELAHDIGLAGLRWLQPLWPTLEFPAALSVHCLGLEFAHALGLAAGFDKNGDCLDALGAMGFSHVELGTVTPRPQPGNPKPRMFRIPSASALINRMGFNNKGVDHLVARISGSRYSGIRGISIGKNFDTPLENAQDDYVTCLRKVYPVADYVAVNLSSPNTARLRELQAGYGLERILGALFEERRVLQERYGNRVPLLVKVAPDLTPEQISALARDLLSLGVDGVIATNTSIDRSALADSAAAAESGGLSGAPLHPLAVKVIAHLRAELGANFPIIGVGGIVSADHALATLHAGANLIQIYTGFAYRGAALLEEILNALSA